MAEFKLPTKLGHFDVDPETSELSLGGQSIFLVYGTDGMPSDKSVRYRIVEEIIRTSEILRQAAPIYGRETELPKPQ